MTDLFALLGLPRRPWLDADAVQNAFLARSADVHPDRCHHAPTAEREAATRRFADLNGACACLRDPRERLAHLLLLARGRAPGEVAEVPADALTLFMEVATQCRAADRFLARREAETSPLLKAALFREGVDWSARLQDLHRRLSEHARNALAAIQALDARWPGVDAPPPAAELLDEAGRLHRSLTYATRWTGQVEERLQRLMLPD